MQRRTADRMYQVVPYHEDVLHARSELQRQRDVERRQALVDRFWSHHAQWAQNTSAEQRLLHREHEMATRLSVVQTAATYIATGWRAFWRWVLG